MLCYKTSPSVGTVSAQGRDIRNSVFFLVCLCLCVSLSTPSLFPLPPPFPLWLPLSRVSLCSLGSPGTNFVYQAVFEFNKDLPASAGPKCDLPFLFLKVRRGRKGEGQGREGERQGRREKETERKREGKGEGGERLPVKSELWKQGVRMHTSSRSIRDT